MERLSDEQIGDLWKAYDAAYQRGGIACHESVGEVRALIIKLVEERAKGNWAVLPFALRDFHIPPETWPKEGA